MLEIIIKYKDYLQSQQLSKATVKNYISDVNHFLEWFEEIYHTPLDLSLVTPQLIKRYQNTTFNYNLGTATTSSQLSNRSMERHMASIRKFFQFLKDVYGIEKNSVFSSINFNNVSKYKYLDNLQLYRNYLYEQNCSNLTIKNYLCDIKQFNDWCVKVSEDKFPSNVPAAERINDKVIEEYKNRLLHDSGLSPVSINRKLSAIRKYINWSSEKGFIKNSITVSLSDISSNSNQVLNNNEIKFLLQSKEKLVSPYSEQTTQISKRYLLESIAFIKWLKKLSDITSLLFDTYCIIPIAKSIENIQYIFLRLQGKPVFISYLKKNNRDQKSKANLTKIDTLIVNGLAQQASKVNVSPDLTSFSNISKSFYAPLEMSTHEMSFFQKWYHKLRHNRPIWYKRYHKHPIVHYLHFAVLFFYIGLLVYTLAYFFYDKPLQQSTVFAALPNSPPKILSFQGKLMDKNNKPITATSTLRFSLYNDGISSGSALLWQDLVPVAPDQNGNFSVDLGKNKPITENVIAFNPDLYLGITVGNSEEMRPRQHLPTNSYSQDSETVQGLQPITTSNENKNVILALDSAGNLSIGGPDGTTLQTTEGDFRISGQALLINTNPGSNGSIVLAPDGQGFIDLQKPLQNTSEYNNLPLASGSVEVDDTFSISATSSAIAAFTLYQDGQGLLINASSSAAPQFTLDNQGNAFFNGNISLNGNSLGSSQTTFSLLPDNVITLNIGASATEINLGAATGSTFINNNLDVYGSTTLGSNNEDQIIFKGSIASDLIASESAKFNFGSAVNSFNNAYLTNLFLTSSATTSGFLRRDNSNIFLTNQNDGLLLGGNSTDNALIKLAGSSGQDSFLNAGKVAIGTTGSLTDSLHVYGDIRVGTSTTDGCLKRYDGTAIAGTCSSDIRLKKNIMPIENVLDKITTLQPVTFTMRADEYPEYGFGAGTSYGLIAQDVEKIFPQLVSTDEHGYKTVKYGTELSMLTLEAIKELTNQVNVLKTNNPYQITSEGDFILTKEAGTYQVKIANRNNITNLGAFAKLISARITTGLIQAKEGAFDSIAIANDQFTIAGQSLREYILQTINDYESTQNANNKIISPLVQADLISPLAEDSDIALAFRNSQLEILNSKSASGSAVASFDRYGNATFSGTLTANNLNTNEATIAGTLHAGKIIADQIDGLDSKIATLAASTASPSSNTVTNIYNVYNTASPSALQNTPTPSPSSLLANDSSEVNQATSSANLLSTDYNLLTTNYQLLSTNSSAALAYVPNFKSDFATITNSLMVYGTTSLADVSVANQLSIGGNLILADNTINVIGASLELQPLKQGLLSMMGGLVTIDTEGNLTAKGNATFAKDVNVQGTLAAGIISPINDQDLVIRLQNNSPLPLGEGQGEGQGEGSVVPRNVPHSSALVVQDSSGSAKLSINSFGDLIASGSGLFSSLNIVRGAQADTSAIDTVASGSAGLAAITNGYTSRTIYSPFVKDNSLIYISPRSETTGAVPYLSRQTAEDQTSNTKGSFTVQIPNATSEDIQFNWWIVN